MRKITGSGSESGYGSICERHDSADPDLYTKMSCIRNTAFFSLAGADESSPEAAEQQQQQQSSEVSQVATEETAANNSEEDKENQASEAVAPPSAHNGTETNGEAKQVFYTFA